MAGPIEFRQEALPPFGVLEREWRELEAVARPSFFTSWYWIGTLLAAVPAAKQPSLLRGLSQGNTVALALLGCRFAHRRLGLVRSRTLCLNEIGDPSFDLTIEHNGLLIASSHERAGLDALTRWFSEDPSEADELRVSGSSQRFPEPLVEGRGLGRSERTVTSYSVDLHRLSTSQGELYPVLSANARQQLRRAIRHYGGSGQLQLKRGATLAEAHSFFAELKELHSASWERRGKPHAFTNLFFESFHNLLIDRSFGAGAVDLLRVSAGARVIGYLYNFRLNNHIYAYQSGFAYDDPAAHPGMVAHAMAIQDAYRSGASVYDFLAGGNRLKESFSTNLEPMLWQVIQQPRILFRLEHAARRVKHDLGGIIINLRRRRKALLP